jgi:hypothetical protein
MSLQNTKDLWSSVWLEFAHPSDIGVMMNVCHFESGGILLRDNRRSSARSLGQQMGRKWTSRCDSWFNRFANIFDARVQAWGFCKLAYDGGGYSHWAAVYDYDRRVFLDRGEYSAATYAAGPNPSWRLPPFTADPEESSWLENNPFSRPLFPTVVSNGERDWRGDGRVSDIQSALTAHGVPSPADGVFGNGTEQDVKDFQTREGLGVDGFVGSQTAQALGIVIEPSVLLTVGTPAPEPPPDEPTFEERLTKVERQAANADQRSKVNRSAIEQMHGWPVS